LLIIYLFPFDQGTDEHFAPSIFAAGAASDPEDEQYSNHVGAECWE
jgi:hypothetical protein